MPNRQLLDTDRNEISSVEVQISDDVMEQSQGLMDVRKLPENHGMLFKFDTEEPLSFGWQIPLCIGYHVCEFDSDSTYLPFHHPFRKRPSFRSSCSICGRNK